MHGGFEFWLKNLCLDQPKAQAYSQFFFKKTPVKHTETGSVGAVHECFHLHTEQRLPPPFGQLPARASTSHPFLSSVEKKKGL